MSTTYLITGANRGLGRGLLTAFIQRPNVTVVAGVRDTNASTATSLLSLPTGAGSKVILAKIDVSSQASVKEGIKSLHGKGVEKLDVVISNAGISNYYGDASATPLDTVREHHEVNVIGTLALFQETWPLLQKSKKPTFVALTTGLASITDMEHLPVKAAAYGMSKAAVNYLVRKIHFENPGIISFAISPGWVQTDMGNFGAQENGMEAAPVTIEQSIGGMVDKIDGATRDGISGTFASFNDDKYNW